MTTHRSRVPTRRRLRRSRACRSCRASVRSSPPSPSARPPARRPRRPRACSARPTRTSTFSLTARDGYVSTPDGNSIYMWSYGMSSAALPAARARRCASRRARPVTVILHNTLPEATSIVFPGQKGVQGGRQPGPAAVRPAGGSLTSMVQPAAATSAARSPTRSPPAAPAPTSTTSGTDVDKQVQMGLYGALVVRPAGHAGQVNDRADSAFNPEPRVRLPALGGRPRPAPGRRARRAGRLERPTTARYFMINGRSMPDTLAPNNASWLPNQPYGALVHIQPYDAATNPDPAVIRYLNAGTRQLPVPPARQRRARRQQGRPARSQGAARRRTCRT